MPCRLFKEKKSKARLTWKNRIPDAPWVSYIHFVIPFVFLSAKRTNSFPPSEGDGLHPHFRPRSPLNLLTFGAVPAGEGLTTVDERSVAAPSPVDRPSNLSHGATSALRGCGPVFSPPIARREEGGSGQSMVDAALEATLGATLGA